VTASSEMKQDILEFQKDGEVKTTVFEKDPLCSLMNTRKCYSATNV